MAISTSWSIRKSLALIVLLATIPAMAIIAITGMESKKHAEQDARETLLNLARSIAMMHRELAGEATILLGTLEKLPQVKQLDIDACDKLFAELLEKRPELSNVFLTDPAGRVIASGLPQFLGTDLSDRDYYRSVTDHRTLSVGGYVAGRASKLPVQVFAIPLLGGDGSLAGMVCLSFRLQQFENILEKLALPAYVRVTFMDAYGLRLFTYPESSLFPIGQYSPMNFPVLKAFPQDEGTYRGKRNDNADVILALSKIRLSPDKEPYLYVVNSAVTSETFWEAGYLLKRNIVLLLLAAILALTIALLIGKATILRGLDGLMQATSRLGAGDLATRADTKLGGRELRQLAETFNGMALTLQTRQEELKASAATINKMRSLLNNILESMPSAVIGLNQDDIITHWNSGAHRLCGIDAEQAVGKPLADVFPWLAGQLHRPGAAPRNAPPVILQKCSFTREDEVKFMDVLAYPLVANGIDGAVLRVDDVTARVQLEAMMVQSEKMSTVGSLAAGMAHDINNPLAGILQSVQNIQRRISPDLQANAQIAQELGCDLDKVHAYLEKREILTFLTSIKESGERAGSIVRNMLGFIRKSSSDHVLVQLSETIDHALELAATDYDLKKKYDFRNIEIVREYAADLPAFKCSPSEIEQVFYNLAANAAQAMATNPKPDQRSRLILRTYFENDHLVAEMEDNGPGMSENIRKRVFEPLFTTKAPGEGTGLGLAVSYFIIVNSYHGELLVESQEGQGTKFTIKLPAVPKPENT